MYGATPLDVGITRDGYKLTLDTELEDLGETDAWGLSVIDGIFRGGNCFLQYTSVEYKAGSLGAYWPYGGAMGGAGVLGVLYDSTQTTKLPIGQLASNIAQPLVLTAGAGEPTSIATLTATFALLAKNSNLDLMFNSKLRDVPTRLRLYPYTVSSVTKFFATT